MAISENDIQAIADLQAATDRLRAEISKVVIGQREVVDELMISLFSGGHCLLVGVPGLAKTLLVRTLARALDLTFGRIQFTPDLMPSDITGTEVLYENRSESVRELRFLPGPVFANVILADEINRTPPKTQAALLEAMQERQVTVGGQRHGLPEPFFVLATQNPIEQEGTYPLPEAQLDRFMFLVQIDYPDEQDELAIMQQTTSVHQPEIHAQLNSADIIDFATLIRRVPLSSHVARRGLRLVRLTRPDNPQSPEFIKEYVRWGAGPRAAQFVALAAKARAAMAGRYLRDHGRHRRGRSSRTSTSVNA